jgi:putative serine protease PepD
MSTRDGLEQSRSPDSDTHTQPLPGDRPAAGQPQGVPAGPETASRETPPHEPSDPTWPPSWGQSPSREGPSWPQPPAAQGASWGASAQPTSASPDDPGGTKPPAGSDASPTWAQPAGPAAQADQTSPGWGGQGGGGYPTVPAWGARPSDAGSPRGRRPSRMLAAAVAAVVLLAGGYGISEALDRNNADPPGAGIPTAAPIASAPAASAPAASATARSGEEPAAVVAKALLPTVVEVRRGEGVGSGFVYDKRGYIMTAAHVVTGVDEVDIRLYDGTKLRGKVLGADDQNDVAVIKVDRDGLAAAPLAIGQTLQVGQLAIAIGSPFGLAETVTAGIVSSTDRVLPDGREVIQTDAPINPGNSGGVLADRQGRVIGINSAIRPANDGSNGNVGIGFAVPIDLAATSAEAIVQGKQVETGYLGVTTSLTTGGQDGALVQEVASGSPADRAGLRAGDRVVAIDGQAIQEFSELAARIRAHKPGDKVALKIIRNGNETTVSATLTQRPGG